VSGDFIGALLSRVTQRADQETVSTDAVKLSGYEFRGLVESTAEVMAGDLGISRGDAVATRTFPTPFGPQNAVTRASEIPGASFRIVDIFSFH
jgi:hypothetical protein